MSFFNSLPASCTISRSALPQAVVPTVYSPFVIAERIAAQQTYRANNYTPLQLCGASWSYDLFSFQQSYRALILSDHSQAVVYNFSRYFACESSEIATNFSASSNTIPSQAPGPWVDLPSSSNPLPTSILPVVDQSGLFQLKSTDDLLSDKYCCSICSARFPTYQALGGHMSHHSKEKRKRDQFHAMPSTSRKRAKNVGGSSSKKKVKSEPS
ncbi:hypothetical protein FCM35_KLT08637 [Carex littledalei]|uniref:C2H2-type domain-containing protein n=1 Tax=Carex littledalei TaxID=544730 RepID=A0A833V5W7_9POAL|nr:hypothetical protein FCM35_KLT08637 [Carex littledalei]